MRPATREGMISIMALVPINSVSSICLATRAEHLKGGD
jgi:hypothetical protein